ncbi:hypothetical protein B0H14DRAFT_3444119 [Mycena olivaceomarginata]|nr:hypothetical protein B0H14DRAFT_3444119 [Mycena olivaceomarginata]
MPSLLILLLLHLVALNCPVWGHLLRSREEPIACDPDVDTRTLFNIISGCLATIFACTWVSVHPNVPGPDQGKLARTGRRLGLMVVAVIAPELMAGFAARQFLDARWFSKKYNMSVTHGFCFAMGGFVSADGHHPIATEKQLDLHPEYLAAMRSIREEDIKDKSKGDLLSKGLVLLQGLWFITQCWARHLRHLPLAELEVATLAYQLVNFAIWFLWLHKPLDVQQPISLGPADVLVALARPGRWPPWNRSLMDAAGATSQALLSGYYDCNFTTSTSVPSYWSTHGLYGAGPGNGDNRFVSRFLFIELLVGTLFGLVHFCICWAALVAYIFARLLLIVLSFTTLRALPPGGFVDVNWSAYIPHL